MHLFRWTRGKGRGTSTATLGEPLFQWFSTLIALGVVGVLILIAIVLFFEAEASIRAFGWSFLGGTVWNPQPPLLLGAFPFVYGTLVTSALALLFGVRIRLGIASFLSSLAPPWLRVPLPYLADLLPALPSLVSGV